MKFYELIEQINNMNGNYKHNGKSLYILSDNIKDMPSRLADCEDFQSILITPFLINTETVSVYELHYYEFGLEVTDKQKSHFIDYPHKNMLPLEIIENIKPKAFVFSNDKAFFVAALNDYLIAMSRMNFEEDRLAIPALNSSRLYYQIY